MSNIDKKLFGKRIKELRKAKGLTQEKLAEFVEVDSKHLSRIESGKNLPSLVLMQKIAETLDISPELFFNTAHLQSRENLISDIKNKLSQSDDNTVRLFYKIFMDITN